jgi:hypothetical protein
VQPAASSERAQSHSLLPDLVIVRFWEQGANTAVSCLLYSTGVRWAATNFERFSKVFGQIESEL